MATSFQETLLDELTAAFLQPALGSKSYDDAADATFELARCWGRAALFGAVEHGSEIGPAPVSVGWALDAAAELNKRLRLWRTDAMNLASDWMAAGSFREADELCLELIEARMDAWAVVVALDATRCAAEQAGVSMLGDRLASRLRETQQLLDKLDELMRREAELLSTATETRLLENWRACLALPFRELLPWWLDGTLEAAATHVTEKARALQPSREMWRKTWKAWHEARGRR